MALFTPQIIIGICQILGLVSAIKFPNDISGSPEIICGDEQVDISVVTSNIAPSHIFAKGKFNDGACDFKNSNQASFRLSACGMERQRQVEPRGLSYSIVIVVQLHPNFVTKVDRAYNIKCFYMEAQKLVSQALDVSMLTTDSLNSGMEMPQCTYSLHATDPNGALAKYASVGQKVWHVWQCPSEAYGMLVHSCFVKDGSGNQIEVLDENGCGIDKFVMGTPMYSLQANRAQQETHVFKFADRISMAFSCQIRLCILADGACDGITPPRCADGSGRASAEVPNAMESLIVLSGVSTTQRTAVVADTTVEVRTGGPPPLTTASTSPVTERSLLIPLSFSSIAITSPAELFTPDSPSTEGSGTNGAMALISRTNGSVTLNETVPFPPPFPIFEGSGEIAYDSSTTDFTTPLNIPSFLSTTLDTVDNLIKTPTPRTTRTITPTTPTPKFTITTTPEIMTTAPRIITTESPTISTTTRNTGTTMPQATSPTKPESVTRTNTPKFVITLTPPTTTPQVDNRVTTTPQIPTITMTPRIVMTMTPHIPLTSGETVVTVIASENSTSRVNQSLLLTGESFEPAKVTVESDLVSRLYRSHKPLPAGQLELDLNQDLLVFEPEDQFAYSASFSKSSHQPNRGRTQILEKKAPRVCMSHFGLGLLLTLVAVLLTFSFSAIFVMYRKHRSLNDNGEQKFVATSSRSAIYNAPMVGRLRLVPEYLSTTLPFRMYK